jgi:hypothetical protein
MGDFDLAMNLPPIMGTYYHVCPGISTIQGRYGQQIVGSSSNEGNDPRAPLDSIATAYDRCVSGAGDGIALWSYGTTTAACSSYLTSTLTWSKHGITTVGVSAPTINQRSRVTNKSTSLAVSPLITVSGNNNSFYNMSLVNSGTTGYIALSVTGARNYFENCFLAGGRGMTTPTVNDYSISLTGAEECTFRKCQIGTDTFDQSDIAGAEVYFGVGNSRIRFYDCEFLSFRSAGTTAGMIKLVATGDSIYRTVVFDNCFFHMYRDGNVTSEAAVVIGTAPNNGFLIFRNCDRHGFTDWAAVAMTARVYSASKANAEASGITIAANPS